MNIIGIDVSKEKSTVCILRPYGEVIMSPTEIVHTEEGVNDLIKFIRKLDGEMRIVMEATGAYHFPLVSKFLESGLFVSVINPYVMKKYACVAVRWSKTDKMDSVRIANFGIDNWFKLREFKPSDGSYEELKILGRQYSHYIKMKIESKQNLTVLLDHVMPGIKKHISVNHSEEPTKDKLNDFVEKYWHYDNITKMSEKKFCEDYCKWAKKKGYHASEIKAKDIYAIAKSGITTMCSSIFELYSFNQSLSKISKHLEMYRIPSLSNKPLWGRQIINNILSNENYLGNDDYPQIITGELWNSVQNKKNSSRIPCGIVRVSRRFKCFYVNENLCNDLI